MDFKWKKGILVVSFGTRHMESIDKTIGAIETDIQNIFPEYRIYRAFTSQQVRSMLEKENQCKVDSVMKALERMKNDGITDVVIQPTMIIHGMEAEQMEKEVRFYREEFQSVRVGAPLLHQVTDYKNVVHAIMDGIQLEETEALVVIGHGTEHQGNAAYPTLEYAFQTMGYQNVLVGTLGEFPGVKQVLGKLSILQPEKIKLLPFFVVFGEHVKRQVMGENESWLEKLQKAGYETSVIRKSFGEIQGISRIYVNHVEEAKEIS